MSLVVYPSIYILGEIYIKEVNIIVRRSKEYFMFLGSLGDIEHCGFFHKEYHTVLHYLKGLLYFYMYWIFILAHEYLCVVCILSFILCYTHLTRSQHQS